MSSENGSEFIPKGANAGGATDAGQGLARPEDVLPDTLQFVPLSSRPYFPILVQPVVVDKDPWGEGVKVVGESAHKLVALAYARGPDTSEPLPDAICEVGCVARVHRVQETDGKVQFIAQGLRRFRIV